MKRRPFNFLDPKYLLLAGIALLLFQTNVHADEVERKVLKVCADPNYAPFSTRDQAGFENKIAAMLAKELNLPLEFEWFPQRMGFIRKTLRAERDDGQGYKCDLVMGVPEQFELAITTDPYFRSTYALVHRKGGNLDNVTKGQGVIALEAAERNQLRIGMTERSPGTLWIAKYNMFDQIVPYIAQSGDPDEYPGEPMFKDLLEGKLDAAIVWGPTAGHFVSQASDKLRAIPLLSEPGVKFDFAISAAVRFGEKDWKNQVNDLLKKNAAEISALLKQYNIPLVNEKGELLN